MGAEPAPAGPSSVDGLRDRALLELAAARDAGIDGAADYLSVLRAEPDALWRDGGPRHLTASAVVIDAPAEHVALVWHRKGRFWVQPGGHLEAGDPSLEAAARREVAEEIGLDDLERVGPGPAVLHRHALSAAFGSCREHWDVQHLFRAAAPAAELTLRPSDESPEVRWVPWPLLSTGPERSVAELPEGTVEDMPEKLAAIARYLSTSS
ncbi:NUDIX domain-containing protein [Brachybacterium rhamnosum]|uniref:NUDIX hydrolase n=1 Tax=Brachybacterium rhamnosum TaxID=173361 RepID=A0ABW4PTQ9_9MICO|nr:NUDIX domain-containing protein [Brachybacterium sp. SGAir0954]QCR54417.1 NTP pyrophosphohydrolase [Brachybacterium sp. SGAir0954]